MPGRVQGLGATTGCFILRTLGLGFRGLGFRVPGFLGLEGRRHTGCWDVLGLSSGVWGLAL